MDQTDERERLAVHGDCDAGWCAATAPNEFVDNDGQVYAERPASLDPDPRAPARRAYDDPEVQALRERLSVANGLQGLEIVAPHEVERAARLFFRDGFVVVRDVLDAGLLAALREASARVLGQILSIPGQGDRKYLTESGRLPHRYSYGTASASRQLLHEAVWARLIDLPTTTPIVQAIFGGDDYNVIGAGGDVCLPGAIEYQHLHADFPPDWSLPAGRVGAARRLGLALETDASGALDHRSRQLVFENTPPTLTINVLMSDFTWENGPIRQIPGTHAIAQTPPRLADEPEWMRLSTLVGAKAGAAVFRDNRAWHGATPNLSRQVRAMPNVEYAAPWFDAAPFAGTMPYALWESLPPRAQRLARAIACAPGVWPAGAGVMHPARAKRREAKAAALADQPG